jgi:hypothetical protein
MRRCKMDEEEEDNHQQRFEAEVSQWQRYFEEEVGVSSERARELMDNNWKPTYNKWLDETGSGDRDWWKYQDREKRQWKLRKY